MLCGTWRGHHVFLFFLFFYLFINFFFCLCSVVVFMSVGDRRRCTFTVSPHQHCLSNFFYFMLLYLFQFLWAYFQFRRIITIIFITKRNLMINFHDKHPTSLRPLWSVLTTFDFTMTDHHHLRSTQNIYRLAFHFGHDQLISLILFWPHLFP